MTCPHCGAQWQLLNNSKLVDTCPFCQGDMYAPNSNLTTIGSVMKEIVSRFGAQVLRDGQTLVSLFSKLAPTLIKEKILLQFFVECGGHSDLLSLLDTTPSEQSIRYKKHIQQMADLVGEVSDGFWAAINVEALDKSQVNLEYDYKDLGDENIELTLCRMPIQKEIKFPKAIDGKQVVSISGGIFGSSKMKDSERNNVESIHIPEGVTSIGNGAFYGCKSLKHVSLPNTLKSIGEYAFRSCKALTNIVLPDSLTTVGKGAFAGSNITDITLPEGITSIPAEAFKNCKCLSKIVFPNSLKCVEKEALSGCRSVVSIALPECVEVIDDKAFQGCKGLVNVTLSNGIVTIGHEAFSDCEALNNINLPDSISLIGAGAFSRCFALNNVTLPRKITCLEGDTFDRCHSLTSICIPDGVTSIGYDAFYYCEALRSITVPASVTHIANDAFSYCKGVTVHCYENSYAYKFAKKKNWKIVLI